MWLMGKKKYYPPPSSQIAGTPPIPLRFSRSKLKARNWRIAFVSLTRKWRERISCCIRWFPNRWPTDSDLVNLPSALVRLVNIYKPCIKDIMSLLESHRTSIRNLGVTCNPAFVSGCDGNFCVEQCRSKLAILKYTLVSVNLLTD